MFDRGIESDLVPVAKELGVGVIAFSPLACGLLSDKYLNGIPEGSRAVYDTVATPRLRQQVSDQSIVAKLRALNEIAAARGQSRWPGFCGFHKLPACSWAHPRWSKSTKTWPPSTTCFLRMMSLDRLI